MIRVASPEGNQAGVVADSAVTCENILTIENALISRKVGHLPPSVMAQIDACLKASLSLT